jgi:transposase
MLVTEHEVRRILKLSGLGLTKRQIARAMGLSDPVVRHYLIAGTSSPEAKRREIKDDINGGSVVAREPLPDPGV